MELGLKDRVVLVTGGSRGIGRACAELFAREGAKVALCGRNGEAAEAAARRAIVDDVPERFGSWAGAVQYLILKGIRTNTVEEEMAWIKERQPGIFDVDAAHVPQKFRGAQGVAFDAWLHTLPHAEVLRRLDVLLSEAESCASSPSRTTRR